MKLRKLFIILISILILSSVFPTSSVIADDNLIYVGGMPVGITVKTRGVEVVGLTDVLTEKGLVSPAKISGIEVGDVIFNIGEYQINSATDIEKSISDGKEQPIIVERGKDKKILSITPALDTSGKYRIGLFIKDCINGIGTVTFFKNGRFASLGHPILSESGVMTEIIGGELYKCTITGFIKGKKGAAGELRGTFLSGKPIGIIDKNTKNGVYGEINRDYYKGFKTFEAGEGVMGNATILSTIDGETPTEYSISIIKAESATYKIEKNYVIKITDERLIENTGGIVQGMSGSPIIQNGKIIGAVTHVFLNDPTRGFGISITSMLNNL